MVGALSAYWASGYHEILAGEDSKPIRLAVALGAARSIIRVVDRSVPPLTVQWSTAGSRTSFEEREIHLDPAPILKFTRRESAHGLDIMTGHALHEASHARETGQRYRTLFRDEDRAFIGGKPKLELKPWPVAQHLFNLLEENRVERATVAAWPGFRPYFELLLDSLADDVPAEKRSAGYGPDLTGKLNFAYLACRLPFTLPAKVAPTEAAWWQAWEQDYRADLTTPTEAVVAALDHLREDPKTEDELDTIVDIDQLPDLVILCPHEGPQATLDSATGSEVEALIDAELRVQPVRVRANSGSKSGSIYVSKPPETADSRLAQPGRPGSIVEALRAALLFRSSAPEYDVKLLRRGNLDEEELYRWGMDDHRVFSERVVEAKPDVLLGLLVDMSGSMVGKRLDIAKRLAHLFVWAAHGRPGVETAVWGHTADIHLPGGSRDPNGSTWVYRLWEPGDPISRLGLIEDLPHANNADGHAISVVVAAMAEREQPEKVLVVLSDGQPAATHYGGDKGMDHVRSVCRWAERQGVRVLQIAIAPGDLQPHNQERMFGAGNWIGYTSDGELPKQIAGILARYT